MAGKKKDTAKAKPKVVLKESKLNAGEETPPEKEVKLEDIKPVVLVQQQKAGTVKLRGLVDKSTGVRIGNRSVFFSKDQEFDVIEDVAIGLLFMGGPSNKIVERVEIETDEEEV